MGLFDTYGNTQIKAGEKMLNHYKIGDKTELADGLYIGLEGFIIIKDGKFEAEYPHAYTKWGNTITGDELLEFHNPIKKALDFVKKKKKNAKNKDES